MTLFFILGALVLLFGLVVLRGAPYVPTHRRMVEKALDMFDLEDGETVVDLGSGDGIFLKAAAKRGLRAVGYEINPVLCAIAGLRCWPVRYFVSIRLRDFWLANLPTESRAVFVFLAGPYMRRLERKLQFEMKKRSQPLLVISYGFAIPGLLPKKISQGLYMYELKP